MGGGKRYFIGCMLLLIFVTTSCGILRYKAVDVRMPSGAESMYQSAGFDPAALECGNNPDCMADRILGQMADSSLPLVVKTGQALGRLPEINDGVTFAEVRAMNEIHSLARTARLAEVDLLAKMADENKGEYQFSASLQGLFWMIMDGNYSRGKFVLASPITYELYAWQSLPRRVCGPQAIMDYLVSQYSYIIDLNTAQPMKTFFHNKYGDCTEFTLLGGYLLEAQGYEVLVLTSKPSPYYAHVSVIFKDEQGYWLFDGSRVAIAAHLKKKKETGMLGPLDWLAWDEMKGFDRIYGPEADWVDLIRIYKGEKGRVVPYNITTYAEFRDFIEEYGYEKRTWYEFKNRY